MQFCRRTILRMIGTALFGIPAICAYNQINRRTEEFTAFYLHFFVSALKLLERVKGIEPSSQAWEARILPLNHTRCRERFYC
jgi:hypothetical protein